MAFNTEDFLKAITWEAFDVLKKPDLMALAACLGMDMKHISPMRKQKMLIDCLVGDHLLEEECLYN